jgi:hypothetical protein
MLVLIFQVLQGYCKKVLSGNPLENVAEIIGNSATIFWKGIRGYRHPLIMYQNV